MKHSIYLLFAFLTLYFTSCKKYLEKKPDKVLAVPATLQDFQLMLDNYSEINNNSYPVLSEILADNYYITSTTWEALTESYQRNLYLWKEDDQPGNAWASSYKQILSFNIILDNIDKVTYKESTRQQWENVKGSALFLRAYYFHAIAQLFANPYDKTNAEKDLGIVLRLNSDVTEKSTRATVKATYERIIQDLKNASQMLPVIPLAKSRPSQPAAYGALARTYLSMQEYDSAGVYAEKCIKLYDSLMIFADLSSTAPTPIKRFNKEVVFQMRSGQNSAIVPTRAKIDSSLYNMYNADDLRKAVFFLKNTDGTFRFKGDYDGSGSSASGYAFGGIVTDEMYLIASESHARAGRITEAMQYLNTLLASRWKKNQFVPFTATDANDAISKILTERRKELIFRGTRWTDIRRLKSDAVFSVTPQRIINGQSYTLPPGSARYTLLIPIDVIKITGIPQNP